MFDLGWSELLLIGIVALIVVGPKDLPILFRNVGKWVGKARGMAREFSRAMNDAADQSGIKDVAKGLKAAANPVGSAMDGVKDAARDLTASMDPAKFDPGSGSGKTETGKLSAERAEARDRIQAASAQKAAERQVREAREALARAEATEAGLKSAGTDPKPAGEGDTA